MKTSGATHTLLWLALVLVIVWVVLKFALAITSTALHLIWFGVVIFFIIWLFNLLRGRGGPAV